MKCPSFFKKIYKYKITKTIILGLICLTAIGMILFAISNKQDDLNQDYLLGQLTKASELTTAKLKFTGVARYKDTGVKFINRSDFVMIYEATARAGIDVKEIEFTKVDQQNKIAYLLIPHATIQEVHVDASSIEFLNEGFALINPDEKEDLSKAIAMAEENALEELSHMGILEFADGNAKELITGILSSANKDYTYEIEFKEESQPTIPQQ